MEGPLGAGSQAHPIKRVAVGESARMEYATWAPLYERLRQALGFSWEAERSAARRLGELLPAEAREDPLGRLALRLRGREAIVVGLAPRAGAPPVWRLPATPTPPAVLAADGATLRCLDAGLVPDVITTDLDGPVASEVLANARGAFVVVHAHGDNGPALEHWVPQFHAELAGSWAGPPAEGLIDVGGFTDGDRAAYLAEHLGARRILLWGFDFARAAEPTDAATARKLAKLRWARESLDLLARHGRVPLVLWRSDGTFVDYPVGGPATQ
jgi:uncharacterized Rossmann fold enzyme